MPSTSRRRQRRLDSASSSSSWPRSLWLHLSTAATLLSTSSSNLVHAQLQSNSSGLPRIDFSSLGTVGVVGSFAGLDFYNANSPAPTYSSNVASLVGRDPSGALTKIGETNPGGQIDAICQTTVSRDGQSNNVVFVAGSFTSVGGVDARNIAVFDSTSNTFLVLGNGLDGAVSALACNSTVLIAGGLFTRPVGAATTAPYAGHVARWSISDQTWSPLPFSGLNGPVSTIEPSADGKSLFFGGRFNTTFSTTANLSALLAGNGSATNASTYPSLGSSLVPISLNSSDYVASPTTYTSGFGRPQYVFCPKHADGVGASWLLVDGTIGYFIVRMYRPLLARGVRLGNTFYGGRGTKTFSFVSIPNDQVLTLTYVSDPRNASSPLATCSTQCPLAHDSGVPYQDFLFPENTTMTGFQLNILDYYGPGGGLHLLQLLSDGAYAYAVESNNDVHCDSGLGLNAASTVSTTGVWNETKVVSSQIPGTTSDVLVSYISAGTQKYQSPTITWKPYVAKSGNYSIYLDTPGCQNQGTCANRLSSVGVYVTPYGNITQLMNTSSVIKTEVNQTNLADAQVLIYQGPLVATSIADPALEVTICLGDMGAPTNGSTYELVANLVTLVAASTNGNVSALLLPTLTPGYGLFEYAVSDTGAFDDAVPAAESLNATSTLTNATAIDRLASHLGSSAIVNAIVSVGAGDSARIFVGGNFTYSVNASLANSTTVGNSTNVVAYSKAGNVTLAPNGGLDGVVTAMLALNDVLYAAGTFNRTIDGTVTGLQGIARWVYPNSTTWSPLGASIPSSLAGHVTQLAVINDAVSNSTVESIVLIGTGSAGAGVAVYNPSSGSYNSTRAGLIIGNISAFGAPIDDKNPNATTYLAGSVIAAMDALSPSGSFISRGSDGSPQLTAFGYQLASSSAVSDATAPTTTTSSRKLRRSLMRSLVGDVAAAALSLPRRSLSERAPGGESNIVTSLPSTLSASPISSEVLAGAFWKNGSTQYMILGGHFTTADSASPVVNLGLYNVKDKTFAPLQGELIMGTIGSLEVVGDVLWIGGNFSSGAAAETRQGLTTYQLKSSQASDQPPALTGYSGEVAVVHEIAQRPGFSSQVIVAGAFASAGAVPSCQSICSWDTGMLQWSPLAGGLQGVVGSITFAGNKAEYLYAAGDFVLNGEQAYLAQWHFSNSSWTGVGDTALPGPATAVSADNYNEQKLFVAGTTTSSGATYLWYFNGSNWTDVNHGVVSSSGGDNGGIQQLVFLPLSRSHPANDIVESNRMLLVSGAMSINNSAVASALYDGASWYPYLLATAASGAGGAISQLFYSATDFSLAAAHHLSVGIVILISIAIALGVVFLLVLIGLLIALARRRDDEKPHELHDDAASIDMTKNGGDGGAGGVGGARRPTSLLATVGAATAVLLDSKHEKSRAIGGVGAGADGESLRGLGGAGAMSYDSHGYDGDEPLEADSTARARYSFTAEHPGELSVSAGEDLTVLENGDPNWFLVANSTGQRGLMPASYLA